MARTLWRLSDKDGTTTLRLTEEDGRLGVLVAGDGTEVGMLIGRGDAQQLRHAVTQHLVDAAPRVQR